MCGWFVAMRLLCGVSVCACVLLSARVWLCVCVMRVAVRGACVFVCVVLFLWLYQLYVCVFVCLLRLFRLCVVGCV